MILPIFEAVGLALNGRSPNYKCHGNSVQLAGENCLYKLTPTILVEACILCRHCMLALPSWFWIVLAFKRDSLLRRLASVCNGCYAFFSRVALFLVRARTPRLCCPLPNIATVVCSPPAMGQVCQRETVSFTSSYTSLLKQNGLS